MMVGRERKDPDTRRAEAKLQARALLDLVCQLAADESSRRIWEIHPELDPTQGDKPISTIIREVMVEELLLIIPVRRLS